MIQLWLFVVAATVILTLAIGGATRITDSGLSITEWKPVVGIIPPLTDAGWRASFEQYQQIPEFRLINPDMTVESFRAIYWWEWGHRLSGRLIGLVFVVPLAFFWLRGWLAGWLKWRLLLILGLGGLQGVVGWWMVTSGFIERVDVSQYRLALHLTLACLILALTVWTAYEAGPIVSHERAAEAATRRWSFLLVVLVFVQIALGGLVAGLDAGLAWNTWPLMDGSLIPDGLLFETPWWINLFENRLTVQFDHRIMGYALCVAAIWHAWRSRQIQPGSTHAIRAAVLAGLIVSQAVIGVAVVLLRVPAVPALVHQVMAAGVLWYAVRHAYLAHAADVPAWETVRANAA